MIFLVLVWLYDCFLVVVFLFCGLLFIYFGEHEFFIERLTRNISFLWVKCDSSLK